jgi:hypothetical protein
VSCDWIEKFLDLTSDLWSPESFRLWAAIGTIASVLERKVYTDTDAFDPLRPNLYIILTGPPATGKGQVITIARQLLGSVNGLFLAPDNPTKRTFLNALQNALRSNMNGFDPYCAMTALVPELSVLISKYEKDFVADLTHIYDSPQKYTAPRQTSDDVDIERPTLNILAGTTPDALNDIMPENAWGQGFCSRILFIYGAPVKKYRNIFKKKDNLDTTELEKDLAIWFKDLHGPFIWDQDAMDAWDQWFNVNEMAPVPNYQRLANYVGRRDVFPLKLAMISAVSAGHGNQVMLSDWKRGLGWLLEAEKTMPDVFRAMGQKSDNQLLIDMHHFVWILWKNENERIILPGEIYSFFSKRAPVERIPHLLKTAEQRGFLLGAGFGSKEGYKPNTPDFVERNSR